MNSFENQIFISYAREQRSTIEGFVNEFHKADLTAWWDKDIPLGEQWREEIDVAIEKSRHFLLYCTVQAKASNQVKDEIQKFKEDAKGDPSRKIFVLKGPGCEDRHVPSELVSVQYADSLKEVIIYILKEARKELDQKYREFGRQVEKEQETLEQNLASARAKVDEARKYYGHRRFWGQFAENKKDVHIFTCGRDIPPDENRARGTGGFRTNIDKWDYRAVLDIAHFFASNYPGTKLTIEDPASKLQQEDIAQTHVLANRIAEVGNLLKDKDCIIVGSPDVNDFAEIALSKIHKINPYDNNRRKFKGYVLIRDRKNTASAFYWEKNEGEHEGIARLGLDNFKIYKHVSPSTNLSPPRAGEMHGVIVVAPNPFSLSGDSRIMILSGFSGVATNAMAKFLTEDIYLSSFFEFDDEVHAQQGQAIEAVISVKYIVGNGSENKDARHIDEADDSIKFEELVAV